MMMIILRNLVLHYFNHSCHVINENVRLLESVSLGRNRPRFAIEVVYSRPSQKKKVVYSREDCVFVLVLLVFLNIYVYFRDTLYCL